MAGTRELLAEVDVPVWCLTRRAVAVTPAERIDGPAALWGFGRVAALHDPVRWGGLVDVPADLDSRTTARLRAVLGGEEDQIAVRAAGVYGRRLARATAGGDRLGAARNRARDRRQPGRGPAGRTGRRRRRP